MLLIHMDQMDHVDQRHRDEYATYR
jgi:hypothetical protein